VKVCKEQEDSSYLRVSSVCSSGEYPGKYTGSDRSGPVRGDVMLMRESISRDMIRIEVVYYYPSDDFKTIKKFNLIIFLFFIRDPDIRRDTLKNDLFYTIPSSAFGISTEELASKRDP
jgi:hypothetical protein